MTYLAYITQDLKLDFRSQLNEYKFKEFHKKNPNVIFELKPRQKISPEARGYFEGALVPAYCDWAEGLNPLDKNDNDAVRELFKREFNGRWITGLDGQKVKVGQSTTLFSRRDFREVFIDKIVTYFMENQIPIPNPDLYKKWRDEWVHKEPELNFWQFLRKHKIKPDGTQIDLKPLNEE
jgi:hypothetical protein